MKFHYWQARLTVQVHDVQCIESSTIFYHALSIHYFGLSDWVCCCLFHQFSIEIKEIDSNRTYLIFIQHSFICIFERWCNWKTIVWFYQIRCSSQFSINFLVDVRYPRNEILTLRYFLLVFCWFLQLPHLQIALSLQFVLWSCFIFLWVYFKLLSIVQLVVYRIVQKTSG